MLLLIYVCSYLPCLETSLFMCIYFVMEVCSLWMPSSFFSPLPLRNGMGEEKGVGEICFWLSMVWEGARFCKLRFVFVSLLLHVYQTEMSHIKTTHTASPKKPKASLDKCQLPRDGPYLQDHKTGRRWERSAFPEFCEPRLKKNKPV